MTGSRSGSDAQVPPSAPVTLRDVARHAGVSVRTVSNVVNDFAHVAAGTRARVQRSLDELGYRPNLVARNLRRGRSGMIALVLPEIAQPYFAELGGALIAEAGRHYYTVIIDQTDGDADRERDLVMGTGRSQLFDGLIFSPLALGDEELAERTAPNPVVLLGERISTSLFDAVVVDNVAAARTATEHLLGLGRRRIAAIGDQSNDNGMTAQYRTRGFLQALRAAGRELEPQLLVPTPTFHRSQGAPAMAQLLDLPDPPDAVFCYNDLLAQGAMRAILSRGLRIPEDVAVVGYDDTEEARYSNPALTSIAPDKGAIARIAVERLMARLDGLDEPGRTIQVGYDLAIRESTVGRG